MKANEQCTEIVSFMTLGAGGLVPRCDHIIHIVKMDYFFKNLFSTFRDGSNKHEKTVLMMCL